MEVFNQLSINFIDLAAEASPWLLLGLIIAGLMKAWIPTKILSHHLGSGKLAIIKAALIGAPLPLCSCGVIPVATELSRSGASAPATSSFLVATPETGVDSVSVSYAMLGPIFAIYRPITAVVSAIITGFFVSTSNQVVAPSSPDNVNCCSKEENQKVSCCSTKTSSLNNTWLTKTLLGLKYAITQLIDDIIWWLFIGLVFATLVRTFVPTSLLLSYGSGLGAMLIMIAISIPMYICATASTPIAAGFIMAGISPGTALVFMMAGPATNISTLGVIKKEMGNQVLIRYLSGIAICALASGSMFDWGVTHFSIDITQQMQHSHEMLPRWFGVSCSIFIAILAIKPLRSIVLNNN